MKAKNLKVGHGEHPLFQVFEAKTGKGFCVTCGNLMARLRKKPSEETMANGVFLAELTPEQLKEHPIWNTLIDRADTVFKKETAASIIIRADLLRDLLGAVDTPLVRLDLLPSVLQEDESVSHLVDGAAYIRSMKKSVEVDGLRVVEITEPAKATKEMEVGDSAALLGALHSKSEWFIDEAKANDMQKQKGRADVEEMQRQVQLSKKKRRRVRRVVKENEVGPEDKKRRVAKRRT